MAFDLVELREEWNLDWSIHHVNHGSFGAVPRIGRIAQQEWQLRAQRNPVGYFMREAMPAVSAARMHIAHFLHAQSDDIALVRNSTEAVSTILRGFPFNSGDEIVVFDQEYGAVILAAERAATLTGARVVQVEVPRTFSDDEILGAFASSITGRTRMLIVDHVTSMTARVMPIQRLAQMCREQEVVCVVDASHTPGNFDAPLANLDVDFWFGNLHKWACAPIATGVLYVSPQWRQSVPTIITSWQDVESFPVRHDMLGTVDYSAWLATPAVLDFIAEHGWPRWRAATKERAVYGAMVVMSALGISEDGMNLEVPMALVPLGLAGGRGEAFALQTALAEQCRVESAITTVHDELFVRISGQIYNDEQDYQALAAGLVTLIA
jgi:isopenicillin-N epimerase